MTFECALAVQCADGRFGPPMEAAEAAVLGRFSALSLRAETDGSVSVRQRPRFSVAMRCGVDASRALAVPGRRR